MWKLVSSGRNSSNSVFSYCSEFFLINKTSGEIKLAGNDTDYSQGSYTLIVEASDLGNQPRTTNVLIMIAITGKYDGILTTSLIARCKTRVKLRLSQKLGCSFISTKIITSLIDRTFKGDP